MRCGAISFWGIASKLPPVLSARAPSASQQMLSYELLVEVVPTKHGPGGRKRIESEGSIGGTSGESGIDGESADDRRRRLGNFSQD